MCENQHAEIQLAEIVTDNREDTENVPVPNAVVVTHTRMSSYKKQQCPNDSVVYFLFLIVIIIILIIIIL